MVRKNSRAEPSAGEEATQRLFHELQVHQIELESQNQQLRQTRQELEASLARYTDLYDFAPVGYFTLDGRGAILEANLTGAALLSMERTRLRGRRLASFLAPEGRAAFQELLTRTSGGTGKLDCELALAGNGQAPRHLRLTGVAQKPGEDKSGVWRLAVEDISERKQAQEDLRQAHRLLLSAIDALPSHVAILDQTGTIVAVNGAWRRFALDNQLVTANFGVGASYLEICQSARGERAEEASLVAKAMVELLEGQRVDFYLEYPCHGPSEKRWFSLRMIRVPLGNQINLLVAHDAITDHIRTEDALGLSEDRYRALFEHCMDSVLLTKPDGTILDANPAACRLLGYTLEDLRRAGRTRVLDQSDPRLHEAMELRARQGYAKAELTLIRQDGVRFPAEVASRTFEGRDGELVTSMLVRDLTERKQAEAVLLNQRAQELQTIMDTMPLAVCFKDESNKIIRLNPAAATMFGKPIEDIEGGRFGDFMPDWLARKHNQDDLQVINSGQAKVGIWEQYANAAGELRWARTTKVPWRDERGKIIGVLVFAVDITERKQAEEQLAAHQEKLRSLASQLCEVEEAGRLRIASDLHDSVGQKLGMANQRLKMLRAGQAPPPETLEQVVKLIDQAIASTRHLTAELSPPVLYQMGLGPALEWLAERQQDQHHLSITFRDDGQPKPLGQQESAFLFRAAAELVTNALKHARAKRIDIILARESDTIELSVIDDGGGFDCDYLISHTADGFGLFSISERIRPLGGALVMESQPGRGTHAKLRLPLSEQRKGKAQSP